MRPQMITRGQREAKMWKSHRSRIWYGEATVLGYDLRVLADTEAEAKSLLISEHQKWHKNAKTGTFLQTWEEMEENTDCRVFEMELGKVWRP